MSSILNINSSKSNLDSRLYSSWNRNEMPFLTFANKMFNQDEIQKLLACFIPDLKCMNFNYLKTSKIHLHGFNYLEISKI